MNVFKISVALSIIFIAVSCNKEIDINYSEIGNDITIRSGVETRAGYTSQSLPTEFVIDIIQGKTGYDYSNVRLTKAAEGNTYYPSTLQGGNIALKWANSNHSGTEVKAMTIPSGVATTLDDYQVHIDIEENQTTEANFKKNDILGAGIGEERKGVTIDADDIILDFSHLMTKLHVAYELVDKNQTVEYIKLRNVCTDGYYSYKDMAMKQSGSTREEINMYLNPSVTYGIKAAEAIFYPYTATNASKPKLAVKLYGQTEKVYEIPISNNRFDFVSGKRYLLNIKISSDGTPSANGEVSSDYDWVRNVPGGKILWVGTSIPQGGGTVFSYPQMVANATGLNVVNNAVGGSMVTKESNGNAVIGTKDDWDAHVVSLYNESYSFKHLAAGGLTQTIEEAKMYRENLEARYDESGAASEGKEKWVNDQIRKIQSLSYQSLIIPYIDGTKDNCSTVIIDHGFNDLTKMVLEAQPFGEYPGFENSNNNTEWGYNFLTALGEDKVTLEAYKAYLQPYWDNPQNILTPEFSYILAMQTVIDAIRNVNPNVRIIIGNYFAPDSQYVNEQQFKDFAAYKFTKVLLLNNKAVAGLWDLDIVNVYESKAITDLIAEIGWYGFCIDGVHPSSETTGRSNRVIAEKYLEELSIIFGTTTKSPNAQSYTLPDWEDVEIL